MNRQKLVALAIFVGIVAAVALQTLKSDSPHAAAAPAAQTTGPSSAGEFRGVSLQLHCSDPDHPYEKYIDEIAGTGANTINLVLVGWQENCSSASIFIDVRKAPSANRLKQLIAYSHKKGLRVSVMPIVLLERGREGEWRGKIKPDNWDDWWDEYNSYILYYAQIVEDADAEIFMVGSELISVETQTERWQSLIQKVRAIYHGRLSYSSNWDHYKPIKFWDDLDIVGMTTYYDLTGGKPADIPTLLESWKPIKREILDWQATVNRPIIFTEVGWPNQVTCAEYPWDYYRSPDKPDTAAQANCFEAFFQTWIHEKAVAGFLVWEWRNSDDGEQGEKDTSYVPYGKPAMSVIAKYYQYPSPWDDANIKHAPTRPGTMASTSGSATSSSRPAPASPAAAKEKPASSSPPPAQPKTVPAKPKATPVPASPKTAPAVKEPTPENKPAAPKEDAPSDL